MRRPAGCSDWTSSSRRSLPRFLGDYPEVSLDLRTDTMIDRVQEGDHAGMTACFDPDQTDSGEMALPVVLCAGLPRNAFHAPLPG